MSVALALESETRTGAHVRRADRDRPLVEALQAHEPTAAERLVSTYGDRAYRLAVGITRNGSDAEEAVQDACWNVVRKIGTTPRTLQRRLCEHQVDFKRLVEDTRQQLAVTYLRDPRHTLSEIAYLLGYSEVSAFNRAFKRWTGATPSSYRRGAVAELGRPARSA